MADEQPPTREPHYFDNQQHGWALDQCARNLLATLCLFVHRPTDFIGSASGHAWIAHRDDGNARIAFTSDKGDGHVQLSVHESHWVMIEVFILGTLALRAWADEPYEEKELWPDAADGIVPSGGDPPGRISKRGAWTQLRRTAFGLPVGEHEFFDLEIPETPDTG